MINIITVLPRDRDFLNYRDRVRDVGSDVEANYWPIHRLFRGLIADGLWNKLGTALLLAGPDTLAGAFVPLRADMPIPTNVGFVSGDFERATGPIGNGSKYINTNFDNSSPPQDDMHMSVYLTEPRGGTNISSLIGRGNTEAGTTRIGGSADAYVLRCRNSTAVSGAGLGIASDLGLIGISRTNSTNFAFRRAGGNLTLTSTSQPPLEGSLHVFGANGFSARTEARIAAYTIGKSLDLAQLDARLTAYMAALV